MRHVGEPCHSGVLARGLQRESCVMWPHTQRAWGPQSQQLPFPSSAPLPATAAVGRVESCKPLTPNIPGCGCILEAVCRGARSRTAFFCALLHPNTGLGERRDGRGQRVQVTGDPGELRDRVEGAGGRGVGRIGHQTVPPAPVGGLDRSGALLAGAAKCGSRVFGKESDPLNQLFVRLGHPQGRRARALTAGKGRTGLLRCCHSPGRDAESPTRPTRMPCAPSKVRAVRKTPRRGSIATTPGLCPRSRGVQVRG